MKNKKRSKLSGLVLILLLFLIIGSSITLYRLYNPEQRSGLINLSLFERRWIEDNKNNIIDMAILNNVPIFSSAGEGIIFSFIDDFSDATELEFNKVSYNVDSSIPNSELIFRMLSLNEQIGSNDFLIYEDNYIILSKQNRKINDINNLGETKVGILKEDNAIILSYLGKNNRVSYTPTDTINDLSLLFDIGEIDYIIIPRNEYLDLIVENNYFVVYTFSDLTKRYVLTYNIEEDRFASIINKFYSSWMAKNYQDNYNDEMFKLYSRLKSITDENRTAFKGKRYVYGYVDNRPYEALINVNFRGINSEFTNSFASFTDIEFTYKKYNSITSLLEGFAKGEVDILFDYYDLSGLDAKYIRTIETIYSDYVVLNYIKNDTVIDTLKSLDNKRLDMLKGSKLSTYIDGKTNANITLHDNVNNLISNNNHLIVIDYNTYNYYRNNIFRDYMIIYQDRINANYGYIVADTTENKLFYDLFQYYLATINHNNYQNIGMANLLARDNIFDLSLLWLYILIIPIFVGISIIIIKKRGQTKKVKNYAKTKYIDPLTSLKNRYYLNSNISKWEDNSVYPQSIIIIDLNNLKEVNDNHGQEEGDRLIKITANILVNNQLEKTDIIRTDGDEFMVYMVGYNETEVIAYIRKLYRLLKDLPYDYGASLGYSMILDDIKTVDDAINEAVLDMITNKQNRKKSDT